MTLATKVTFLKKKRFYRVFIIYKNTATSHYDQPYEVFQLNFSTKHFICAFVKHDLAVTCLCSDLEVQFRKKLPVQLLLTTKCIICLK